MSIGDWLFNLFSGIGPEGIVLCIFLLFFIDAVLIPTLPELFFILGLGQDPTFGFGTVLLLAAIFGELVGIFSLYYIVKHIRVPKKIANIAEKYINFLILSDEKALLMNRVAPMIPFAGAFIALVDSWDPKKCAFWIVSGCVLKYGAIMAASNFFFEYLGSDLAQTVTLVLVFAIIIISFVASYYRKRKEGLEG